MSLLTRRVLGVKGDVCRPREQRFVSLNFTAYGTGFHRRTLRRALCVLPNMIKNGLTLRDLRSGRCSKLMELFWLFAAHLNNRAWCFKTPRRPYLHQSRSTRAVPINKKGDFLQPSSVCASSVISFLLGHVHQGHHNHTMSSTERVRSAGHIFECCTCSWGNMAGTANRARLTDQVRGKSEGGPGRVMLELYSNIGVEDAFLASNSSVTSTQKTLLLIAVHEKTTNLKR